ncbi:MAG: lysylphosphatidylglycerol synthase transmembrane domain-containing protein [Microthrixaceae bacterium]
MSTDSASHDSKDRRNRVIAAIVTLVVLVIVFAGILPKFGNYAEAWDLIKDMSVAQLAVLGTSVIFSILVYVFPFQVSLPGLRYWPAFMIRQTSFTISNAVPAGGAVGLGVQYGMLAQAGFSGASATAAIGITSVFNLMVTLALPVLGVLALLFVTTPTTSQIVGAVAGLGAIVVMVGFFAAVLRSEENARKLGNKADLLIASLADRFHKTAPSSITEQLIAFRSSTVDVVTERWALLTGTNFAQQFAQFGVLLVSLRIIQTGESTEIAVAAAFAAFALARLAAFIPVTPGGLGTVDAALTGLLVAFGVSNTDALAATLLWRAASWIPQVLLGVVTFLIWRARSGKMKAAVAAQAAASPV